MTGKRRPVLYARDGAVAFHSGKMQQHCEARGAFHQSADRRSDRRLRTVIATSYARVLRRPIELAQYCSDHYQRLLKQAGMILSMSGKGNCYDNAMVETVFKTIKSELVRRTSFLTKRQAEKAIGRYIDGFYNPTRRHSALGYISTIKFEAAVGRYRLNGSPIIPGKSTLRCAERSRVGGKG